MPDTIKEGRLYDVKFGCKICGCVFAESVDLCDNHQNEDDFVLTFSCQCPTCNTWVSVTRDDGQKHLNEILNK